MVAPPLPTSPWSASKLVYLPFFEDAQRDEYQTTSTGRDASQGAGAREGRYLLDDERGNALPPHVSLVARLTPNKVKSGFEKTADLGSTAGAKLMQGLSGMSSKVKSTIM